MNLFCSEVRHRRFLASAGTITILCRNCLLSSRSNLPSKFGSRPSTKSQQIFLSFLFVNLGYDFFLFVLYQSWRTETLPLFRCYMSEIPGELDSATSNPLVRDLTFSLLPSQFGALFLYIVGTCFCFRGLGNSPPHPVVQLFIPPAKSGPNAPGSF